MVSPPDAEPVSAASTLVATASETSGPPPMPSTQSRTTANAGIAATTAPNPTRLATLTAGRTDALAPASMVLRRSGSRPQLTATTVAIAQARANATDQTPATAESVVAPHRGSARKPASSLGSTMSDITRLTAITTTSGNAALVIVGSPAAEPPCVSSAGSN